MPEMRAKNATEEAFMVMMEERKIEVVVATY